MTAQRNGADWDHPFPQAARPPTPAQAGGVATLPPSRSSVVTTLLALLGIALVGVGAGWYLLRANPTPQAQVPADSHLTAAASPSPAALSSTSRPKPVAAGRRLGAVALSVNYRSTAGHFVANFSEQPVTERATKSGTWGFSAQLYMAQVQRDDLGVITYTVHPAVTLGLMGALEKDVVDGFRARYGGAGVAPVSVRFQGHDAIRAQLVDHGIALTALSVQWSLSRGYLILAPTGPRFAAFTRSFHALG